MTGPGIRRHIVRNGKKNRVPLSTLRASEAVRTVVASPRRMEELLRMLEDKDRSVRGRAAVALAQLSESHPARLLRVSSRLREMLGDDAAHVRWHLLYALGRLMARYPRTAAALLSDIVARLDDENRVCRLMALRAVAPVAEKETPRIEEVYRELRKSIPPEVSRVLRKS